MAGQGERFDFVPGVRFEGAEGKKSIAADGAGSPRRLDRYLF